MLLPTLGHDDRMTYVLAAIVVAVTVAIVVGAVTGRVRMRSCCPADPDKDLRMRC